MPNFDAEREYKKKTKNQFILVFNIEFTAGKFKLENDKKKRITVSSKLTLLKNIMLTSFVIFKVFLLNFCVYITGF